MKTVKFFVFWMCLISPGILIAQDPVVAEVNGTKIKKSELEKAYMQNLLFVSDKTVSRETVLNSIVDKMLGIQRAKGENLHNDPVVKSKMEEVLYHAKISKDLEGEFKKIKVSEKDVKSYYRNHPEYHTAHILFRVKVTASPEEIAGAQQAALQVYRQVSKQPNKFTELAKKHSQSNLASKGGDMGFQPAVRMAPEYFRAVKGRAKGHISPPVRTQFGYHIIKVLGVQDYASINQSVYKKIVYDQKRDALLADYFAGLRKKAKIVVHKEHLRPPPIDPDKLKK